jgi:hypothetical protein
VVTATRGAGRLGSEQARRNAWLLACAGAVVLRLYVMLETCGTNDIVTWQSFARSIHAGGLLETYRSNPEFNHPPLMGLWALVAGHIGGFDGGSFPFVFKLLPLGGDLLAATLIFLHARRGGDWERALKLACVFLWNPVSVIVTAYHGNTDPLMAALCLWAALLAVRGQPLAAGLALGAAFNVKIVALLLLLPIAAAFGRSVRDSARFAAGFAIMCAPFVPVAFQVPGPLIEHVFKYNSALAMWGFNLAFTDLQEIHYLGPHVADAKVAFLADARYLILAAIAAATLVTVLRRRSNWLELSAFALCLSLVLAPGFGYQYLAWPLPLLFALDWRRAAVTSVVGGVFLVVLYLHFWDGRVPGTSWTGVWPRFGVWWGVITWMQLLGWSWRLGTSLFSTPGAHPRHAL